MPKNYIKNEEVVCVCMYVCIVIEPHLWGKAEKSKKFENVEKTRSIKKKG